MVVAVNEDWKSPVGFFPAKSFTASEKPRLLKICHVNYDVIAYNF